MLINTYLHIYGIGTITEKKFWREGLSDWYTFMDLADKDKLPYRIKDELIIEIQKSIESLKKDDYKYFKNKLYNRELWRSYPEFREKTAYLDIETTGLDQFHDKITLVGLFDGKKVQSFIQGKNLDQLPSALKKYSTIVTFNGLLFDIPFIATKYPNIEFDHIQLDLRFILSRLGYRGGLKSIERQLGVKRTSETTGLTGFDAVKLWKEYERGRSESLELLIKYNKEDIVNLEKLMRFAYDKMRAVTFRF